MKTRVLLYSLPCWLFCVSSGSAAYNITIPNGWSMLGNNLSNDGNTLNVLLPNPNPNTSVYLWNCAFFSAYTFDDVDLAWMPNGNATIPPGSGAIVFNPGPAITVTFSGNNILPVLPSLPCGCDRYNLLSRQTDGTGTYENITGYSPQEGSQVLTITIAGNYVTNRYTGGAWSLGTPLLDIGQAAWFLVPCSQKWVQIPDTTTNGLDVKVTDPKILADDFRCTATGPITEVRVRGSWRNDAVSPNACFCLSIWTDVPAGPNGFSRPGQQLCNYCFQPGQYTSSVVASNVNERFYDPNLPGISGYIGFDNTIWEYVFPFPPNACIQTNNNIYWLSVEADCFDTNQFLFGWKTCPTNFNDDAVYGHVNGFNQPLGDWNRLQRPPTTNSLDLSFTILTSPTSLPPSTNKWIQLPDLTTNGLDVRATQPKILADDFLCTQTGPISQVRIWGSWWNDRIPTQQPCFYVGIWTDDPGTNGTGTFSRPAQQICSYVFNAGQYTYFNYASGTPERFFDPNAFQVIGGDSNIWEYVFDFPTNNPCVQTNGNVYWLSIWADCFDTSQFLFGWKTSPYRWHDDAVWGHVNNAGTPLGDWNELFEPPYFTNSLNLAFQITTRSNPPPNYKWLQIPDTSNNGLDIKATDPKILADDFRCDLTGPITQIHIWTSWRNDYVPTTACFCLGIWSDIPRDPPNTPWSRPGQRLCDYCFFPGQYTNFVYATNVYEYFFDPNIGEYTGFDTTIWEYVFDIPADQPCIQTNGNIYWLSVTADCFDTNIFMFGWKTCPTNWNDDAVYADQFNFNVPPPASSWIDLLRPFDYTQSLDLAFEIITQTNPLPNYKWLQIPDVSTDGLDVRATEPKILADDFRCTLTGPISEIHVWGSWRYDQLPPTDPCFCLGIWSDMPASPTAPSRPDQQLCRWCFYPGDYTNFIYRSNVSEQFFDPNTGEITGTDNTIWEYVFRVPTNQLCCIQTNGNIYWLSVEADCFDANTFQFGWKTCPTNFNDDAVFGDTPLNGPPPPFWTELRRPPYFTNSLDLAFEIITATNASPPVITIDCPPDKTVECGTGWSFDPPVVNDPCCGALYTLTPSALTNGNCPQVITVTWTVVDCIGLTASCTNKVTVVDTTPPLLTCSANKTVECGSIWNFDQPGASDRCCGTNVTILVVGGFTNNPNTCTQTCARVWQAKDCCTNLSLLCTQLVTVVDTTPPVLTCVSNKTVQCYPPWSFDPPSALDACCGTNLTVTVDSTLTNSAPCPLVVTRTWKATDCCSNSILCSQKVTVLDTNPPTIICSNIVRYTCATNIVVTWSLVVTDLCNSVTWTSSPPSGTSFNRDTTNTVIATVTDACGNTNGCSFLVMVRRPTLGIGVGSELRTNIIITWDDGGVLQHATNVTGPWENLPGATSPFTTNVLSARRFFRVCCP